MGITKILFQKGVVAAGNKYDVLIPLPATHDECMKKIGLDDFTDIDDDWDADFCEILKCLIGDAKYGVVAVNPQTHEVDQIKWNTICDIQGYLAQCDHLNFTIQFNPKEITFTRGHEIFWLDGPFDKQIEMIRFPIVLSENERIKELF